MVLLSDKKYACETCIKGHRSSACKHTDRPLFEIKKKGRPVTQCEHCRELRKTKQVHVKCLCGLQNQGASPSEASHSKKGPTKLPAIAAFPHGLPEDLETMVVLPAASDGSADSDHSGETSPSGCRCNTSSQCDCWTPRKPAGRRRSSVHQEVMKPDRSQSESLLHDKETISPSLSPHVLARIAELRPVLPRPSRNHPSDGFHHDPSLGVPHGHGSRHHSHESMHFSPYGRAYGHAHVPEHHHEQQPSYLDGDVRTLARRPPPVQQNTVQGTQSVYDAWQPSGGAFPSPCTCGDSCRCPGCSQHSNAPIAAGGAYSSCSNPATCSFCLDCTILSLPSSTAPPLIDSASDSQTREFEEWLRQVSSAAAPTSIGMQFTPYELSQSTNQLGTYSTASQGSPPLLSPAEGRCHDQCNCSRGSCSCPADCCGCSQGCKSDGQCRGLRTTFAISGERESCCDKQPKTSNKNPGVSPLRSARLPDFMTMTSIRDGVTAANVNVRSTGFYPELSNYISVNEVPSRSSSSSSVSSRMSGRSPINPNPPGMLHNVPSVGVGANGRHPQPPRPTVSTVNSSGVPFGQPQALRKADTYETYQAFNNMQFP
ncbi:hypothetical protein F5I97DRAFT_1900507 [Phlebopus sp. FC_14]|nr:hypothetical protein F5I97DRAFT_1900507 [Phlebopus sp. FC_14]